ncbi:peptidylprolyl isomerase [Roseibium sediminis]|uniref:SurA N-terminal domain-containing protein n=1 Tax=Roseibium sediminis TaxID=1775174 RepID=UPI00123DD228|nr:peptidylprolyl isomerase [Roseibium sediminis]
MRRSLHQIILALLVVAAGFGPTVAQAGIKVIVNETPITNYDISQRAKLIRLIQRSSVAASTREAEQELVEDQLRVGEASRLGISVSETQVNNAFANIASNVKLTPAKLSQALRQSGVNPQTLKDRLKAQLAWQQAVQRRFRSQIKISESDIVTALRKSDDENKNVSVEYDLQRVIVVVPKKSSKGFRNKRLGESNSIRKAFDGCDNPGAILGKYEEVVVRPIGRRLETELPPQMRTEINKTSLGKLTSAQQTEVGFEMIAVCGKREIASDIAARTEVENELREKEGEQMSRRYLMDVKRRATIVYP